MTKTPINPEKSRHKSYVYQHILGLVNGRCVPPSSLVYQTTEIRLSNPNQLLHLKKLKGSMLIKWLDSCINSKVDTSTPFARIHLIISS